MNNVSGPAYFAIIIVAALAILTTGLFILVAKNAKWPHLVFAIRHWLANQKALALSKAIRGV